MHHRYNHFVDGGKGCFPNQATWNSSRFYKEFHVSSQTSTVLSIPSSSDKGNVSTLFTLTPLDASSSSFSEMEVMSDNSSIITAHHNNLHSTLEDREKNEIESDLVINCQIKFPISKMDKAILSLDDGHILELDRNIFWNVENQLRSISRNTALVPSIKTRIVPKDNSLYGSLSKKRKMPDAEENPYNFPKPISLQNTFLKTHASSTSHPLYTTMQNTEPQGRI